MHVQLGAGQDNSVDYGSNPRGLFRVVADRTDCVWRGVSCFAEYDHHSSITDGRPFNRNSEQLTNQFSLGVDIPIWRRSQ